MLECLVCGDYPLESPIEHLKLKKYSLELFQDFLIRERGEGYTYIWRRYPRKERGEGYAYIWRRYPRKFLGFLI